MRAFSYVDVNTVFCHNLSSDYSITTPLVQCYSGSHLLSVVIVCKASEWTLVSLDD